MRTASIGVSFVNGLRSARRQAHDTAGGTLADCGWLPCAGLKSDWRRLPFGGAFRVLGGIPVLVPIVLPQGLRTPAVFIFAYAEARPLPETLPPPRGAIRFFSGGAGRIGANPLVLLVLCVLWGRPSPANESGIARSSAR